MFQRTATLGIPETGDPGHAPVGSSGMLDFVYSHAGEAILLDGSIVIKGTPAKLLLWMLRAYTRTGKALFFLAEFRKQMEAFGRPSNLEARLLRLADRLEERVPGIRLRRERGYRMLQVDAGKMIGLREI